jgi:RNA polymerase sigma-70 factor (sigma-E family)
VEGVWAVGRAERPADFESYAAVRRAHLRRTAYLLTGDWDRAEDVVQDTLTKLFVHWRRASRADDLDAYVRRMLVNAFLSERRRPWRRERSTDELPDTSYADPSGGSDDRDELRRALVSLGPSQRAVIVLRYWDDLSVEQTADALGCSTGNVKSQSARGLAHLRAVLGRSDEPDPEVAR